MSQKKTTYKIKIQWISEGMFWWKKTFKYYCIYEVILTPIYPMTPVEDSSHISTVNYSNPTYKESFRMIEKHLHEQHALDSLAKWLKYNSE